MYNGSKVNPPQITHIPAPTTQQQNQQRFNWGSILKPAAGGLFGIASSVFNHFMSERSAEKQYQRQLDFWQKQNEYNSPAAQRKRLEAAGFNPAAALGDIAGNNAAGQLSSVPGNDHDKRGFLDLNALSNSLQLFTQMESIGANTDMMKRQIELSYIEELIKNSTKYGIDLSNQEREELLKWLPQEKEANLKTALEQIDKIIAEREHTEASSTGINIDNNNKQRQYDDAHRAADDAHSSSILNNQLTQERIDELEFSNNLNTKFAELERQLQYDFTKIQGDVISQTKAINESAVNAAFCDQYIFNNYGRVVSDLDPMLQPYWRYLGAKISVDWDPDGEEAKEYKSCLKHCEKILRECDYLLRDPEYINSKDRKVLSQADQKRLDDLGNSLVDNVAKLLSIGKK